MTTIAGDDTDDDPRKTATRLLHGSSSPSENWDDDFEFQAGAVADARDNAHDAMNAPMRPGQPFEQEESWDDAYEDDNTHPSPIKRTKKAVDDDAEDWDSSDNELESHDRLNRDIRRGQTQEFGFGGFEEDDKTVTVRSTSSQPQEPPPALPLPIPPSHSAHHFQAHTVLPPLATSPTLSTFSIPLSSTTRDRASIYSQDPLMPTSNSSAPHLSVIRSYPHAAGSTPPRRGRRLRKKSRPPEADIFELEDRELDPVSASITAAVNAQQLDVPPPTTPPRTQQTTPESPSGPSQPSAPPTPSSLLTRIGSLKRWARRSMGPDDPSLSGWRRTKTSTGPSEAKSSHGPGELVTRGGKLSTGAEVRKSTENSIELDVRAVSPTPAPGGKARRSRGESASGLKSGWFFRAGGAVGSEKDGVTPTVQTLELTPSKRASALGLRRRNKEPAEEEDVGDDQGKTPTPRKAKAKLVPALKLGAGGIHRQGEPKSPTRASKRPSSRDSPDSLLHNVSRPRSILFPRNGTASIGRNGGLPVSASNSGGAGLLTSTEDSPEKDGKVHGESKDKDSGMRSLMNGVRRLSLVGAGHTHKRTKSTGGEDGAVEAARKDPIMRPRSQIDHYPSSNVEKPTSHTPIVRLGTHPHGEGNRLLPPVELEPPVLGMSSRRGSLPWADYDHSSTTQSYVGVSFAGSAYQPLNATGKPSQPRQSFSTSTSSLHIESPEKPLGSGPITTHLPTASGSVPVPVPMASPDIVPRSRPLASAVPAERRPALESRQAASSQPHSQSQSPLPSTPQSASLGRSTASPSHSGGLRRNSLGDLKTPLNTLSEHKAQLPPLGELKIPARISRAQQGLRRDMGMVREFAGCVEELKRLQVTYMGLLVDLRDAYEASLGSPSSIAAQVQFHLPSRPQSQIGYAGKAIAFNSNPSVQHIPTTMSLNSPTLLHPARSFSRASQDVTRELVRLEHEYGIWWECAELLVELGGGSGVTASSASNPNLATRSTSALNTPADDLLTPGSPEEKQVSPKPNTHVSSMSEPGSLFEQAISTSNSKGPPQASPPHPSQWRASTGRHDLSARQLRLLKDMLNTPDPASLAYAAGPYGYGAGYPHLHSHLHTTVETQPWGVWNPSAVTLPSEESSVHSQGAIAASEARKECKEKKRRASRLGMLGLREILRGLKRNAVAEGRLGTGDQAAHGQQGSESSMSNGTPDDDHYNRRRSPWHQHDDHHVSKQSTGAELNVAMDLPPSRNHPPKSPRRPSLASIFRIGNKNVKNASANGKSKDISLNGNGTIAAEHGEVPGLAAGEMAEYADWERMSRSDLEITAIGSGTTTVRAKKAVRAPASRSSINLNYPYSSPKTTTPKKTPATSQTSLWDSSPSSVTSPQSRLPVSIAEEGGDKHSQNATTKGGARSNERTSSWSQAHPPRPTSRNGKGAISGTVRSAPPSDFSSITPDPKLALTPENIKPLLEYAKEVGIRLNECISEVQILLGTSTKAL